MMESFLPILIYIGLGLNVLGLIFFIFALREDEYEQNHAYDEEQDYDEEDNDEEPYRQEDEDEDEYETTYEPTYETEPEEVIEPVYEVEEKIEEELEPVKDLFEDIYEPIPEPVVASEPEKSPYDFDGFDLEKDYDYKDKFAKEFSFEQEEQEEIPEAVSLDKTRKGGRMVYEEVDLNVPLPKSPFEEEEMEEDIEIKYYEPLRYQQELEGEEVETKKKKKTKKELEEEAKEELDRSIQDRLNFLTKEFQLDELDDEIK